MSNVSILRVNARFIANRFEISCPINVELPWYVTGAINLDKQCLQTVKITALTM